MEEAAEAIALNLEALHELHCASCFSSDCPSTECAMTNCPGCNVRMHTCKMEDHCECICAMTKITCPNAFYGCSARMFRHKINEHIQHCSASLVYCPFIRDRQFVSKQAKKMFKRIARGHCNGPPLMDIDQKAADHCCSPDIALARIDQRTLCQAFRVPRAKRFSLAKLALRRRELDQLLLEGNNNDDNADRRWGSVVGTGGDNHCSVVTPSLINEEEDSSDEEAKINASQYRAMREPFSGCRLCAIDPGSQHLHQLGSLRRSTHYDPDGDQKTKHDQGYSGDDRDKTNGADPFAFLPIFSRQNALFIANGVDSPMRDSHSNVPARFRQQQSFMRTNFPIFACDEFVRRDQYSAHCWDHLSFEDGGLAFFARCPNAQYGCQFSTDQLLKTVDGGQIKFNPFLGMAVHVPMPLSQCPAPPGQTDDGTVRQFAELGDHFFALLGPFLDDASLRSLSSTCRRFWHLLPSLLHDRLSVELRWSQNGTRNIAVQHYDNDRAKNANNVTEKRYEICGTRRFFGISQHGATAGGAVAVFARLQTQPRAALIDHLFGECKFYNQHSIYDQEWIAGHKRTVDAIASLLDS